MMVNEVTNNKLILVLQIDHSRVAGQLAAFWGNDTFESVSPYESMVLAAQEHDTGWWEWESKPTLNQDGYPLDYIGSASYLGSTWLQFYESAINRVEREDPYAAYMVSMHGEGLLTEAMGLIPALPDLRDDPDIRAFLDQQQDYRERMLTTIRASEQYGRYSTEQHIWTNYKYMEVFDQLAQFVCNRYPFNSNRRTNGPTATLSDTPIPIRAGVDDTTLQIDVVDEENAIVRPYPFSADPITISFPAKQMAKRRYATRSEFLRDFYTADPLVVTHYLRSSG